MDVGGVVVGDVGVCVSLVIVAFVFVGVVAMLLLIMVLFRLLVLFTVMWVLLLMLPLFLDIAIVAVVVDVCCTVGVVGVDMVYVGVHVVCDDDSVNDLFASVVVVVSGIDVVVDFVCCRRCC